MCSEWLNSCFLSQERKEAGKWADGPEQEKLALEDMGVGVAGASQTVQFLLTISYERETHAQHVRCVAGCPPGMACSACKMCGRVPPRHDVILIA